ncbi:MAG: 50S ribosomal protein L24 [Syntrophales bacterium]|jgi:large subunit ribosomal protein L24|nr:50S ribosomal protein L24 [Syntrophales bacterium]MCK9527873.1 50S ribosomal protein L24 [Syntrophales bacterium]MDX9921953.1 50S ribosomal protein L24 [Syntrophales bacterium]
MHVKKGDTVKILAGKEKGKTGKILSILQDKGRVVVEKVNFVKKHQRPDGKGKGGILQKEGSIHLSNVMVLCGKCEKGIRVGYRKLEDGKKVRVCRKCGEVLDA